MPEWSNGAVFLKSPGCAGDPTPDGSESLLSPPKGPFAIPVAGGLFSREGRLLSVPFVLRTYYCASVTGVNPSKARAGFAWGTLLSFQGLPGQPGTLWAGRGLCGQYGLCGQSRPVSQNLTAGKPRLQRGQIRHAACNAAEADDCDLGRENGGDRKEDAPLVGRGGAVQVSVARRPRGRVRTTSTHRMASRRSFITRRLDSVTVKHGARSFRPLGAPWRAAGGGSGYPWEGY